MSDEKPETTERSIVEDALQDHRECMHVVSTVEGCLDSHPDREGRWIEQLRRELPRLAETLRCHFSAEQEGPLYRSLPVTHPRFAPQLRRLEAEHARIVRAVEDAVLKAASFSAPHMYQIREFNAELQLLVAQIRRHEAEENEIILSAHWDEVGTGD